MHWIDPSKDVLSIAQQVVTVSAGLVGFLVARRWQKELRGKTRHQASESAIKAVYHIRSLISVARTSYRTVLFTQDPSSLKDKVTVKQYDSLAQDEKSYWENHLTQIEAAGVAFRNESILAEAIWGDKYSTASDQLKARVDEWTNAVTSRIESLDLFLATKEPDQLNSISPILISDTHYTNTYFDPAMIAKAADESLNFWNNLDASCKAVKASIGEGWLH